MGRISHSLCLLALFFLFAGCSKDGNFVVDRMDGETHSGDVPSRNGRVPNDVKNVMLLYSAGFNSLSPFLSEDISDLSQGTLPGNGPDDHILLVFSQLPTYYGNYSTKVSPVLFRMYRGDDGFPVRDTVKVWPVDTRASDARTVHDVLDFVYKSYPADGYGMVFSSHGTGWLPSGYYTNPSYFDSSFDDGSSFSWVSRRSAPKNYPREYPEIEPFPVVKSVGQDEGSPSVEIELADFAAAIPYKLDYLLFDACLMGTVEVAWELRGKASIVGFSQTEVLAEGFNYQTITTHLLTEFPDPVAVCRDYFELYDARSGSERSATISVVDTDKMDALAEVCRTLFAKYHTQMDEVSSTKVQRYYRYSRQWFYDLRDILKQSGASHEDLELLDGALSQCVIYKAATPNFLSIPIKTACGLSMYLPKDGSEYLDNFYRSNISWNDATALVQ